MRNKYPGKCYRCGEIVEAGKGHFEKLTRQRRVDLKAPFCMSGWLTQHADCALKHTNTNHTYWKPALNLPNGEQHG